MSQSLISGGLVPAGRKLPGLHGLRGIAALVVITPHVAYYLDRLEPISLWLWPIIAMTAFGVQLFFVLSAFSLFHTTKLTEEGLAEYAIKRFFRIAPLFYAMIVFQQIYKEPVSLAENLINITFMFGIVEGAFPSAVDGGWSVGVEMIFYAVLPLVLIVCKTRRDYIILAVLGTIAAWASHRYVYDADPVAAEAIFGNVPLFTFPGNMVAFCYGLLAYAIYRETKDVNRAVLITSILAVAGTILLVATPLATDMRSANRPGAFLMFTIITLVVYWQALRPSRLLTNPLMQYVGERSFSTYLVQFPIAHMMQPVYGRIANSALPSSITLFVCYLVTAICVIAAATLTHRFIEVPGVNFGRRLVEARRARHAAAATPP